VSSAKEQWLTRLVDESGRDLLRFLAARLASETEAEDLAQEVYLRLLRVEDVGLIHSPRSFALRVAANVAHEWRLLARNRLTHSDEALDSQPDATQGPYESVLQTQEMKRLAQALDSLSPTCRAVVLLHRRDGLTYEEIASFVGLSVAMVNKHLARGLAVCQEFLAGSESGSNP
jgi:RNA polymerase sigma factor (sigma-70 family)